MLGHVLRERQVYDVMIQEIKWLALNAAIIPTTSFSRY